jgi:SdrD B-like domain
MKALRHHRKSVVAGLVALGTLVSLVTFVVLPAVASTTAVTATAAASPAYSQVPPGATPSGIIPIDQPTGGQSNDCSFFYSNNSTTKPQPAHQFRIANPKKGSFTYTDSATGASFVVRVDSTDKWASFAATGAKVVDVGIKGGTDETWYNYDQAAPAFPYAPANDSGGYVTADGGTATLGTLHAPAQDTSANPVTLYSVSNLTFCYNAGSVSGTVYLDANKDGTNDATPSPADTPLSGWTVRLYGSGSSPVATTTSAADGSYRFNVSFNTSTTYSICEVPGSSPPSPATAWAQSQPYTSASFTPAACTGTGELKKGYSFTATSAAQDITGKDFGNVPAITEPCPPPSPFGTDPNYQIQLATCKAGQTFVFSSTSAVIDGNSNTPSPTFSVFVGDETQPLVPLVEKIVAPFTIVTPTILNPQPLVTLVYDDTFPFSLADAVPMPFCQRDPRATEFGLATRYGTAPYYASEVLPGTATSCLILQSQSAIRPDPTNHPDQGTYTAYVYSELDGLRGVGP